MSRITLLGLFLILCFESGDTDICHLIIRRLSNCLAAPYDVEMSESGMDSAAYESESMNLAESDIVSEHNAEEG